MAKKKGKRKPTDAELAILGVIWEHGPCTVREVLEHLNKKQPTGYTTVLKLMQIMTDKKLLERDSSVRPQVFKPSTPRKQTQQQLLRDLTDRAFGGSPGNLVLQALAAKRSTPEELRQIRELIDQLEEDS